MNAGLISERYAKALYEFAVNNNSLQDVYQSVSLLTQVYAQNSELKNFIDNPIVSSTDKKKLILTASGEKLGESFERFVNLLIENKREKQIQFILLKFLDLYRENHNILRGELTTAITIDNKTEKQLIHLIENQTKASIEFNKIVDPNVLGGFKLEIDNNQWDATIAKQLELIREKYKEQNSKIF